MMIELQEVVLVEELYKSTCFQSGSKQSNALFCLSVINTYTYTNRIMVISSFYCIYLWISNMEYTKIQVKYNHISATRVIFPAIYICNAATSSISQFNHADLCPNLARQYNINIFLKSNIQCI